MIAATREHLGWVLHESGPESADHSVLLLPGALCTAAFYDDLLAEPSMSKAPIRFVATTVPGFGGTAPPEDMSMESYSKLAGKLASDLGCDAVVGHSLGANIAIEMASAGEFSGPLVLLSPSFSRNHRRRARRARGESSREHRHDLRRRTLHPQPAARRDRQARPRGGNEHGARLRGLDVGTHQREDRRLRECAGMSLELPAPRDEGSYVVSGAPCSSWRSYSPWS
jgi:pimeloyl-ACP methyl ester carboxylesterase